MKTKPLASWDHMFWGAEMRYDSDRKEWMLLGVAWHSLVLPTYEGQPPRALLFTTRRLAREWCAAKTIACKRHSDDWQFRAVRVRETITRMPC